MSRPVTILLLEDSDLDAELVEDRLARAGLVAELDRAIDRKSYVARLAAAPYDVILSDYHVPTFEGLAALELARQHQPDTPFIFVSGMMGEELAIDALKQGATDYVLKQRLARLPAAIERAIAERRERAERKQAEALATTILETMGEGFLILDAQWRHTYVNAAAERMIGQTREEILGKDHWQMYPATVGTSLEHTYRRVMAERVTLELEYHHAPWDRWYAIKATPAPAGGGILIQFRDETDAKHAEQERRESEAWFRTLADASPAILWVTDPTGRCTFLSRGWYEFTGQTEEEGLGFGWLDATHPDDKQHSQEMFVAANAKREPFAIDYRIRRADGEYRRAIDAGRPRFSPSGEYLGYVGLVLDVTARRRAEEALRVSEERFAFVRRTSGVGFWYCDLPFDVLEWDDQVKAHFHLPRAAQVTIDMFYERLHPDDREPTRQAIERSIREKDHYDVDYRTVDPATGAEKWVRAIGRTLYAEDGTPIQFDGVTLDISDRKRAEAERQFFVSLAENSTEFIGMYDLAGAPYFVNEAGRRLVGLGSAEEAARTPVHEFFFPDDQPFIVDEFLPRVLRDGRGEVEVRFRHFQTGEARWMIYNMFTVRVADDRQARLATVSRDITERKQAEENLARLLAAAKRNAALLERVAGASRAVNAVLSADSIARILTEEARAILGARVASTTFTTESGCAQEIHAAAVDRHRRPATHQAPTVDAALAVRVCEENRPIRVVASGAGQAPWGRLAVPLVGHGGKNLGVVQLADKDGDDFTAEDEAVLVQLAAIAAVGIENARLYERLQEQDRRKDEFLATLAHELRNPLAPLRNGLEVMRLAAANGATAVRVREMMERQVGHMVRLIDDLLDVSRITRGRVELQKQRVDVRTVLSAALEVSRPLIDAGRHQLLVSLPKEPLALDADPTRLAQVLSNLLNNAAKYTPEGGRIELSAAQDGGEAVIRVRDNGTGIAPDMLPRVFELFTQVGRTLDRAQGGLGIGLALVKRLAEMHGGSITAESEGEGHGSTFIVRLPLARDPEASRPRDGDAAAHAAPPTPAWRVLIVDDNVDAAESLAMLLSLAGHATATAHSGPDAITVAQTFTPEVVFLDIGLPGMNGYEVAMRLRGDPALAGVVLVALTGWGTDDDQKRATDAGFDDHLTKPVATAAVHALLARLPPRAR